MPSPDRRPGGPSRGRSSKGGPAKGSPSTGGPSKGGPSKGGPSKGGPPKGGPSKGGYRPAGKRPAGGDPSVRRRNQVARKHRDEPGPAPAPTHEGPVRLNKFIARAGIASRRDADGLIADGRVSVNGTVVTEMGVRVGPSDAVRVDGHPVRPAELVYVLLNKPSGAITTTDDERDRKTVMDLVVLPDAQKSAVFPVGRLDRDTTGALLLTSDGELAHRLMHPTYGAEKLYLVETERPVTPADVDRLASGVTLEDGPARADDAAILDDGRLALRLHEGRNRQVRRMVEALGNRVTGLDRVGYAGLDLTNLRRGRWRHLQPHEVNALRRSVKLKAVVF